eukprot:scaffold243912_cov15-Tisochrysis_lutea.AAC.1
MASCTAWRCKKKFRNRNGIWYSLTQHGHNHVLQRSSLEGATNLCQAFETSAGPGLETQRCLNSQRSEANKEPR